MKVKELIQLRLLNQRLAATEFESCVDVVSHFGAMQSQDYAMAKWAVGMRMQRASDPDVEMCINSGEIIRTHVLRPTWHFVSRKDIRWMMELSAPYVRKATQYVDRQVGLTDEIFKKIWKIIEVELQREDNLSKEDLMERLAKKKIDVENLMATQILIRAELEMRVCNGVRKKNKITYALFDRRVPPSEKISRKDSLVKLAAVYFGSRSPATVKDFMWWSGLNLSDATFGISGLGGSLKRASLGGLEYLYFENTPDQKKKTSVLLPAYDEYMVGYSEGRDIAFPPDVDKTLLGNGVFKPIVLVDNAIAGTWKKTGKEPFVEMQFLQDNKKKRSVRPKLEALKFFLGK
ncbi:winged helix DNA-binding domain-containing protein [Dawidia soli]|uniref:Winged helix DNA-binding domain-containing protein n=1 Tax=Dawidia soli TaxID=2782352 RepID=A0AAP2GHA7_9BACT|nr:winged helix DNA-binding domain-containing protein [Dawidia soli]MBT1687021.1 winged helix DNA-binding domain-containing protein [Dawidia soli]